MALLMFRDIYFHILILFNIISASNSATITPLNNYITLEGDASIPKCLNYYYEVIEHTCTSDTEACKQLYQAQCELFVEQTSTSKCPQNYDEIMVWQAEVCINLVSSVPASLPPQTSTPTTTDSSDESDIDNVQSDNLVCTKDIENYDYDLFLRIIQFLVNRDIDYLSFSEYSFHIYTYDVHKYVELRNINDCFVYDVAEGFIDFNNCDDDLHPLLCNSVELPIMTNIGCAKYEYSVRYSEFENTCFSIQNVNYVPGIYQIFEPVNVVHLKIFIELVKRVDFDIDNCRVNGDKLNVVSLPDNTYFTIDMDGHLSIIDDISLSSCIVLQRNMDNLQFPKIEFVFDPFTREKLFLYVRYNENLIRFNSSNTLMCYCEYFNSKATEHFLDFNNIRFEEVNQINQSITQFALILPIAYPRYYFCEGTAINNTAIKTAKYYYFNPTNFLSPLYVSTLEFNMKTDTFPIDEEDLLDKILSEIDFSLHSLLILIRTITNIQKDSVTDLVTFSVSMHLEDSSGLYYYGMNPLNTYQLMLDIESRLRDMGTVNDFTLTSIQSISECFSKTINPSLDFNSATIDQITSTDIHCLNENFLPYTRKCTGDPVPGLRWSNTENFKCKDKSELSQTTLALYDLNDLLRSGTADIPMVLSSLYEISLNPSDILPIDFILIAINIELSLTIKNNKNLAKDKGNAIEIADIISNTMRYNNSIIREAAEVGMNSTNILLDSLDKSLDTRVPFDANGVNVERKSNLIIVKIDPSVSQIGGIGLYIDKTKDRFQENFDDFEIRYLRMNQSVSQLLDDDNNDSTHSLEMATFIPESLYTFWTQKNTETSIPLEIIITAFIDDRLFQTDQSVFAQKVFSIKVHGYSTDFPYQLPTIHKLQSPDNVTPDNFCGFFDFHPTKSEFKLSVWNKEGCAKMSYANANDKIVCGCYHLTHFSYLLFGHRLEYDVGVGLLRALERHDRILTYLTRIFSGVSLVGIFFIFVTSIVFQQWRQEIKNVIILQFAFSIALQIILIIIADSTVTRKKSQFACVLMGGSLQYIILVTFAWMFILALRQYQLFVKVFNTQITNNFYCICLVVSWVVPLIPTLLTTILSPELYTPLDAQDICYPKESALYYGLITPLAIVICFNIIIYAIVIHSIRLNTIRTKKGQKYEFAQLRMAIFLFFFLGLTWIFGLLSTVTSFSIDLKLILTYMFNITATLQGFILFLFYIVLNPSTRNLWLKKINDKMTSISSEFTIRE